MTTVYSRKCNYCGRIQEDRSDDTEMYPDPDRWDCWWRLSTVNMDTRTEYDFCGESCLLDWAEWRRSEIIEDVRSNDKGN